MDRTPRGVPPLGDRKQPPKSGTAPKIKGVKNGYRRAPPPFPHDGTGGRSRRPWGAPTAGQTDSAVAPNPGLTGADHASTVSIAIPAAIFIIPSAAQRHRGLQRLGLTGLRLTFAAARSDYFRYSSPISTECCAPDSTGQGAMPTSSWACVLGHARAAGRMPTMTRAWL